MSTTKYVIKFKKDDPSGSYYWNNGGWYDSSCYSTWKSYDEVFMYFIENIDLVGQFGRICKLEIYEVEM